MRSFQGKMKLSANPAESVGAGIEVVAGSLTLIVSDAEVGVWPLEKVGVEVEEDGFHVQVDGEEFVFVTREAEEFARAVGVLDQPTDRRKKPKAAKANGHHPCSGDHTFPNRASAAGEIGQTSQGSEVQAGQGEQTGQGRQTGPVCPNASDSPQISTSAPATCNWPPPDWFSRRLWGSSPLPSLPS